MIQLYPEQATLQLEFDKIKQLLYTNCRTEIARLKVEKLRFHTRIDYLKTELLQTSEYKNSLSGTDPIPNYFSHEIHKELNLLSIPNAIWNLETFVIARELALNFKNIKNWFNRYPAIYPELENLTDKIVYEKKIVDIINRIIDDQGKLKDNASAQLMEIRTDLIKYRQWVRKKFDEVLKKLGKLGYLADINEGYLNGRRTVAVAAEYKRIVKGILHGESESGKTVFIEPEETLAFNNMLSELERAEQKEIQKILAATTTQLSEYQPLLKQYFQTCGIFDFIRSKALLATELDAVMPQLSVHPVIDLKAARHPILFLHNKKLGKPTVPISLSLDKNQRILMISGPNAGGKTVSMKTVGILQLMLQSGLLVPVAENSEMGIFKQIMVHIGDTQSIENELSTYSAHLRDMKYFTEFAHGKTLFFIDELGSGSDPNLGGSFAEAIVEELAAKRAIGIITTHYLNLKVMAGKVKGIVNAAMSFDEEKMIPKYQLIIGKPGSSYTFAIAQRSGLSKSIIDRARQLTEKGEFKLEKMLRQTEQQSNQLSEKESLVNKRLLEAERIRKKYEDLTNKEKLKQHYSTLKLQNKIKKEELDYLREMERNFKQIIFDWKKAENKQEVIKSAENILFKKKQVKHNQAAAKKADKKYQVTGAKPELGDLVRNSKNHQVGKYIDTKGKKAVVLIGRLPFTVDLEDWVTVEKK